MIPEGWDFVSLEDLASVERGKFSARPRNDPKYFGGHIPFVQTGDVRESGGWIRTFSQTLNEEGLKVSRTFPVNTILITIAANIGEVGLTTFEVACPDSVVGIQAKANISPVWLMYALQTRKPAIESFATQNAQKNINLAILRPFQMLTPPLSEQRAIAAILSTWDEAITLTERLIAALRQRKQALMQMLLTGHKTLPSGWRWGRLSEFLEQNKDYVTQLENKLYPRISVKWWSKGAVVDKFDNGLDVKMKRHQIAKTGQIIVSEIWAKHGSIGIIPPNGNEALISSHFYLFDLLPNTENLSDYIYRLVQNNYFMRQSDDASKGTTGYASIRATDFLQFKLPVPPPKDRQFIADVFQICEELIVTYEAYLQQLQAEKRGLMQQLLTGAIRVQVEE